MDKFGSFPKQTKTEKAPSLPRLTLAEMALLPDHELEAIAQRMGKTRDEFKEMLARGVEEKKRNKTEPLPTPEARDEYAEKINAAFNESIEEISIFDIKNNSADRISQYEDALYEAYKKIGDRPIESLDSEEKQHIVQLHKKLHILRAASLLRPLNEYANIREPYYLVYSSLSQARMASNDLLEKEALTAVIGRFWNLYADQELEKTLDLCNAFTEGRKLTQEQLKAKSRILSRARSWAMSGIQPKNMQHGFLVDSVAHRIKQMGIWKKDDGGVSGPTEVFDMPGDRGIGGQLNFTRGPRPHRDDYGASGGQDDK